MCGETSIYGSVTTSRSAAFGVFFFQAHYYDDLVILPITSVVASWSGCRVRQRISQAVGTGLGRILRQGSPARVYQIVEMSPSASISYFGFLKAARIHRAACTIELGKASFPPGRLITLRPLDVVVWRRRLRHPEYATKSAAFRIETTHSREDLSPGLALPVSGLRGSEP
jgi:hypothetical protein